MWILVVLLSGAICQAVVVDPNAKTEYKVVRIETLVENVGGMPALCRAGSGELLFGYATLLGAGADGRRYKTHTKCR